MKPSPASVAPPAAASCPRELALTLALLWFAGAALRVTVLALPPVLPAVSSELGLGAADIGVLAGLPPLLFAVASLPAATLIARIGPVPTLVLGLLLNAAGAAARGFAGGAVGLGTATALMCLGVAVMQPVLPALVRAWAPARVGFATAVYTNGLLVGEVIPMVWTPGPGLPLLGGGWRAALAVWALPVLATAVGFVLSGRRSALPPAPPRGPLDWRDGRVWRAGLLLGGVNASYFGLNGFLPGWFSATGWPGLVRPALVALNLAQIPASLLMLALADRLVRRPAAYGVGSVAYVAAVLAMIAAPGPVAVAAAAVAGFANAALLTLALTVPSALAEGEEVPRLSAAMFGIGYGFAVGMAVLAGRLWDGSGTVVLAVLPFAFTAALPGLLGPALRPADPPRRP
jgi:CP family cyanate transporter-like MFS transporter